MFTCSYCCKDFSLQTSLIKHYRNHHQPGVGYDCLHCKKLYSSSELRNRHEKNCPKISFRGKSDGFLFSDEKASKNDFDPERL